ncbi:DUF2312 domain-containing protein [Rhizobium lentis]|uniref:DUF2312 domain-containing protein n=1 Tax=Rhizobium lentis TaxID=1138194 RepID=UPI001A917723|nr:GapR family DNA-binding domain-containing protein [Rhizobium lentis]MBX5063288.1 DUF2312 domain-containing protein [Rhizobium lentis]MBX5075393.1 DUF2312 domain-containing protein [Rhizobium lentis]QSW93051.1 DUF2312 domain-containing protein [Rhizobium lentis]
MSDDGQIKSFFQRWQNLEDEKQQISDLLKDLFSEAKGFGYDTKALRAAFRRKVKEDLDNPADAEFEAIVDTYVNAINAPSISTRDARVRVRENVEQFDPITGEFVDEPVNAKLVATVATAMQTEIGRQALGAAVDIMIDREDAEEESRANVEEDAADESAAVSGDPTSRTSEESERQRASMVGFADDCRTGGKEQLAAAAATVGDAGAEANGIPVTNSEIAPASQGEAEAPSADRVSPKVHGSADANAGGDHVSAHSSAAKQKAGALVKPAPAKPLRPYCRNPGERCGGYGSTHCASCLKAAREAEVAA